MLDLEAIRTRLLNLKAEILAEQESTDEGGDPVELDQARVGRLSRMDAMQNQQMHLAAARRRQQQLQKIEGALTRLDAGNYGYCFKCDCKINPERLGANPTATRCIDCAE